MQIFRTVFWVLLTALLVGFILLNLHPVQVHIWPMGADAAGNEQFLSFDWPVGLLVLLSFLAGLLPMLLFSKAGHWRLKRRIANLENSVRATAPPPAGDEGTTN